jgi:acetyl/propionyl-CoA carboxylase alpha subunit
MIGKLIGSGQNRSSVIRKVLCALEGLYIEGLKTNVPLHKVIMREENFITGQYTTNYIDQVRPQDKVNELVDDSLLYEKAIAIEMNAIGEIL